MLNPSPNSAATSEIGRVLVVDDNRLNRQKFSIMLGQLGHQVETAESGAAALERLSRRDIDVVLLDMVMPEMNGLAMLMAMKRDPELRDIPVIVVSASGDQASAVECIQAGAEDFLPNDAPPVLIDARLQASLRRKRLRDLEQGYFRQEVALRQNEQLAKLGRLSAGLAHEMNNPAAAVVRGASIIQTELPRMLEAELGLASSGVTDEQVRVVSALLDKAFNDAPNLGSDDPLARSDREWEIDQWLDARGIQPDSETARTMSGLGLAPRDLDDLADRFQPDQLSPAIGWLTRVLLIRNLGLELAEAASRISGIVKALKSYSYRERTELEDVDINTGLNNTLLVLNSKLQPGVEVVRDFDSDLPRVEGFGGELNQVWTNIIDNAIDAMNGEGTLRVSTSATDREVLVAIQDSGPGIPEEVIDRIFDPFFSTKPPGAGTGLGMNIAYNIVVHRHSGRIAARNVPDGARFDVHLPIRHPPDASDYVIEP